MITSLAFPDMFSGTHTLTVEDHTATYSNLALALKSPVQGLYGDPFFGNNLSTVFYSQNSPILKDLIIDEIFTTIVNFIPQLIVRREDINIVQEGAIVYASIKAKNLIDYTTDMFNIRLTDE